MDDTVTDIDKKISFSGAVGGASEVEACRQATEESGGDDPMIPSPPLGETGISSQQESINNKGDIASSPKTDELEYTPSNERRHENGR